MCVCVGVCPVWVCVAGEWRVCRRAVYACVVSVGVVARGKGAADVMMLGDQTRLIWVVNVLSDVCAS